MTTVWKIKSNSCGDKLKFTKVNFDDGSFSQPGRNLTVIGWGTTSQWGSLSPVLMEVNVPLTTVDYCADAYPGKIDGSMICAGAPAGGIDSCQGDSGSPNVVQGPNGPVVIGVTSFGQGCARPGKPGVYSRISYLKEWAIKTMTAYDH